MTSPCTLSNFVYAPADPMQPQPGFTQPGGPGAAGLAAIIPPVAGRDSHNSHAQV